MSRQRYQENLRQIQIRLQDYAQANEIDLAGPLAPAAVALAQSVFLAHSTSAKNFSTICASNKLLSPQGLQAAGLKHLEPDAAEVVLGTANCVFFFAGNFSFPATGCGLLFSQRLEAQHTEDGAASGFDSGGLVHVFTRPDPAESVAAFFARHEWPLPEHRDYLRSSLAFLFADPLDYLRGQPPRWPGPIGLSGGDQRAWTHEVRLPAQTFVRTGYLQAVFAPLSRAATTPVRLLRRWCRQQGVDFITFPTPRANDFARLRRECVDYIRRQLL